MKDYKAMIKGYLEFNNCGEFTITENETEYMVRFDSHNKTLETEYPDKEALRIWFFELEEEEAEETTKFVEGAEYRLHCKDGAIAKRTATFVKWYNKKEGLFKIGATTRPVRIITENGCEYTQHDCWWMGGRDMFDKYQNISAKEDRIK